MRYVAEFIYRMAFCIAGGALIGVPLVLSNLIIYASISVFFMIAFPLKSFRRRYG